MKAFFIAFTQAHYEDILKILDYHRVRGYTYWDTVQGRGSRTGEPHEGSHAWPTLNGAIMAMVPDKVVDILMSDIRDLDKANDKMGLRAFVWNVEKEM